MVISIRPLRKGTRDVTRRRPLALVFWLFWGAPESMIAVVVKLMMCGLSNVLVWRTQSWSMVVWDKSSIEVEV
jgi:hypothetical protein